MILIHSFFGNIQNIHTKNVKFTYLCECTFNSCFASSWVPTKENLSHIHGTALLLHQLTDESKVLQIITFKHNELPCKLSFDTAWIYHQSPLTFLCAEALMHITVVYMVYSSENKTKSLLATSYKHDKSCPDFGVPLIK